MSATTIRLPEELKGRVADAAEHTGLTSHGFILEAIAEKLGRTELRAEFDAEAERRYASIVESGRTIPWQEMRDYLEARAAGKAGKHPRARRLTK
jgi:predicted transcriptional regulator